jgi:hypothetical protein
VVHVAQAREQVPLPCRLAGPRRDHRYRRMARNEKQKKLPERALHVAHDCSSCALPPRARTCRLIKEVSEPDGVILLTGGFTREIRLSPMTAGIVWTSRQPTSG